MASGTLVYRQRLSAYGIVRSFVLGVYVLIFLLMVLDLLRVTVATQADIPHYSGVSTFLGLSQAVLLLGAAQGIYFTPSATYRNFFGELRKRRWHLGLFAMFVALGAFVVLLSTLIQPPPAVEATDFAGNAVPSMSVSPGLIYLVVALLAFFLLYPVVLMVLGASKVEEPRLKRSLLGLGAGWGVVSALYVATETYMWTQGVDATGLMYAGNAVVFYVVIRNFRRSASLAGFVKEALAQRTPPRAAEPGPGPTSPLTESLKGKKALFEVDPAVPYEATLKNALEELAWQNQAVFVFTPKASPLHAALSKGTSLKFFLTTGGVSYMKVAEDTNEVLVPQSDTALFLDVADKTLSSKKGGVVFVFDSVSELLLLIGLEKTYKFLKEYLALLHEPRATGIFLFVAKGHPPQEVNLLRGIFSTRLVEDAEGARLVR